MTAHTERGQRVGPLVWFFAEATVSGCVISSAARLSWLLNLFFLLSQSLLTTLFAKPWLQTHGREAQMKYHLLSPH